MRLRLFRPQRNQGDTEAAHPVACCARAASGHAAAAPPSSVMSERRFTAGPFRASYQRDSTPQYGRRVLHCGIFSQADVRFGSSAPEAVVANVRFTPKADKKGRLGIS